MINANVMLQGFDASVHDANQEELDNRGQKTGVSNKIKLLRFQDSNSGFCFNAIFSQEQFDRFVDQMIKERKVLVELPIGRRFFTRNGGIRS